MDILSALRVVIESIKEYVDKKLKTVSVTVNTSSDWDINDSGTSGYIENRPIWSTDGSDSFTWNGSPTDVAITDTLTGFQLYLVSELTPDGKDLVDGTIKLYIDGTMRTIPIIGYYSDTIDLNAAYAEFNDQDVAFIADGRLRNLPANSYIIVTSKDTLLGYVLPKGAMKNSTAGIYAAKIEETDESGNVMSTIYMGGMSYSYTDINIDDRYADSFKKKGEANVYVYDIMANINSLGSLDSLESLADVLDFSAYKAGDVILITLPSSGGESSDGESSGGESS